MRRTILPLLTAASLLLLTGCDIDAADWGNSNRYKQDFSYDHKLNPGGRVFLENFNGSVEVIGTDSDSVSITGTKYASREEIMEQMKIEVISDPDSLRIRTIRPVDRNCNCGAKYVIRLPKRVTLDRIESSNGSLRLDNIEGPARLRSSNGSIRVWGVKGNVEAQTSNASIEVNSFDGAAILKTSNGRIRADGIRGNFDASTSNASIDVTIAELESGRPVKLNSSNGTITLAFNKWNNNEIVADTSNSSINLRLPSGVNAQLKARTSNGSITTDFEVATTEVSKSRLEGRMGSGGSLIDLSTSNGSIRITRQ